MYFDCPKCGGTDRMAPKGRSRYKCEVCGATMHSEYIVGFWDGKRVAVSAKPQQQGNAPRTSANTQSDEIAALRKRLGKLENRFHNFAMLHEPVANFDYDDI